VPATWQSLTNLTTLKLQANKLTGTVPKWIGGLSKLQVV
jgi:hypothetical protein